MFTRISRLSGQMLGFILARVTKCVRIFTTLPINVVLYGTISIIRNRNCNFQWIIYKILWNVHSECVFIFSIMRFLWLISYLIAFTMRTVHIAFTILGIKTPITLFDLEVVCLSYSDTRNKIIYWKEHLT
jgi:hypothetical protein